MLPKKDQNENHALGVHMCVCVCARAQEHTRARIVSSRGMNTQTREAVPGKKVHTKNASGGLVCGNLEAEGKKENKQDLLVSLPPVFVLLQFSSTL